MSFFKKFDLQSKVIILISLVGIITSLSLFLLSYTGIEDVQGAEVIAKLVESNKDIRVKRSGNIHWYPVSDKINCFDNDLIFTGSDSYATIEYSNGDKIYLHPNSLVSVSLNKVALESGTIELDLNKASPLSIKSFGEEFKVKEKAKFKIINEDKSQKIVTLNSDVASFKDPAFKKFVQQEDITISAPRPGKLIPKFEGEVVNLSWKAIQPKDNYTIEFTTAKSKSPVLSLNTEATNLDVELSKLPEGMVYWSVKSSSGKSRDESSFYLTKDFGIELMSPLNKTNFKLNEEKVVDISFEWTSALDTKKRIQIAKDIKFQKMVHETTSLTPKKSLNFNGEGRFFWRVAHDVRNRPLEWSEPSMFIVGEEKAVSPIEIKFLAKTVDFSITPKVSFQIVDPNNCPELEYQITRDGTVVSQGKVVNNLVELARVDDGNYTIQVTGKLLNLKPASSPPYNFQVKNSKALKAPKLNKKRIKILVKLFEHVMNFIVPQAHASAEGTVLLDWDDVDSINSKEVTYEIEISHVVARNVVLKKLLQESEFVYQIPSPGLYYWRVRTKIESEWSPFSEYGQISAQDEVSLLEAPLMTAPADDSVLKGEEFNNGIVFRWREPFKESSYFLELYNDRTGKLIKKMPVSGGEKRIKLKGFKSVSWRVYGISSFNTVTSNERKFQVKREVVKPKPIPKPAAVVAKAPTPPPVKEKTPQKKNVKSSDRFIVRSFAGLTNSSYSQKVDDNLLAGFGEDVDFNGKILFLQGEYWPTRFKSQGISLGYRNISSDAFKDSEVYLEYGRDIKSSNIASHKIYVGPHINKISTSSPTFLSEFDVSSLGVRYQYQRVFTQRISFDVNTEFIKSKFSTTLPSVRLRPVFNYRINRNFWASAVLGLERNISEATYEANGGDGIVEIKVNNIFMGAGLTWMYY